MLLLFIPVDDIRVFHPAVFQGHALVGIAVVGAWGLENLVALYRYRRLSSFHTYLSKTAGCLLGIFVGVLFVSGFQPWLLHVAAGANVHGNLEELALLALIVLATYQLIY